MGQKQRAWNLDRVMGKGRIERDTHIPPVLSEKIVLKIMKFLSNHFLFFSHFLKVFQEFGSKKDKLKKKIKDELLYMY